MNARPKIFSLLAHASLAVALSACASPQAPGMSDPLPPVAAKCHADAVQSFVGKPASADNIRLVQRQSDAALVRIIKPGQLVTMDFREDRVDIRVDAGNVILQIRCG